jgi:hypothetical protein
MRSQWIPAIGLAAIIAMCGYMVARLDADRQQREVTGGSPAISQPFATGSNPSR